MIQIHYLKWNFKKKKKMNYTNAKVFLDKKQEEHFTEFGVYADTDSKMAEWMEEYHQEELIKLSEKILTSM